MSLGVLLFLFVVGLLLVSIHAARKWRLDWDTPLDDDDLAWPAAGYGSAAISLNCLFGAYSATLLLIGPLCFISVVAGVIFALIIINRWIDRRAAVQDRPTFQQLLFGLEVSELASLNWSFLALIAFCQIGLAISELLLLYQVFVVGLAFPSPHAIAACLALACVGYYYCLLGGYQAVFRTDALQYVAILVMALLMLWLAFREFQLSGVGLGSFMEAFTVTNPGQPLLDNKAARLAFEIIGGLALGIMPVLAAPDAWKRVMIIVYRRADRMRSSASASPTTTHLRKVSATPGRLLLVTVIPLLLMVPLIKLVGPDQGASNVMFPIAEIFHLSSNFIHGFLVLGMAAAFLSTFDGALLTSCHVLLSKRDLANIHCPTELARYRVLLSLSFLTIILAASGLFQRLPNFYIIGAFMVGPFAVVGGVLLATSFGRRQMTTWMLYFLAVLGTGWVFLTLRYAGQPGAANNPYLAAPLVFAGCCLFFLVSGLGFLCSRPKPRPVEGDDK